MEIYPLFLIIIGFFLWGGREENMIFTLPKSVVNDTLFGATEWEPLTSEDKEM